MSNLEDLVWLFRIENPLYIVFGSCIGLDPVPIAQPLLTFFFRVNTQFVTPRATEPLQLRSLIYQHVSAGMAKQLS